MRLVVVLRSGIWYFANSKPHVYLIRMLKAHSVRLSVALLTTLLAWFSSTTLVLAQAKFYANAPKQIAINQNFQLAFTLENANGGQLKLPSLNDFQVLGGPNTSSSMQWVNGAVSQSVTYSYVLRPKKEGSFKIGKASIQVSGVTMESNELNIDVTGPVQQQPQTQQRQRGNPFGWDPFEDPFGAQQRQPEPEVSMEELQKQLKDEVFIKTSISDGNVYKGEALTVTYKLYFRQNLGGFNVTKAPAFDGFWSQEVELDPKRRQEAETVNGKQYYCIDILKYNLYPQRGGRMEIPAVEAQTVAQVAVRSKRGGSIFDDFFNMNRVAQVPLTLKSNVLSIQVKELPEAGKPQAFNGAVGKFTLDTKVSATAIKTDEPVTYTVKISGSGNLKFIDAPVLKMPAGFEVYDPKVKESITNSAAGMSGSKQYDFLIIPHQPGEYTIEPCQFAYFDPAKGQYVSLSSEPVRVQITGEPTKPAQANEYTGTVNKETVSAIGEDILYIKTQWPDESNKAGFLSSGLFMAAYTSPVLLLLLLAAYRKRQQTELADVVGYKRKRALKLAKQRLQKAHKLIQQNDKSVFYQEVSNALWGYLADKLNIAAGDLSKEYAAGLLQQKQVSETTIQRFHDLIAKCELALYAPSAVLTTQQQDYDSALNLIADFEDEYKL